MGWGEQIPWSVAPSGWPDLPVGLTTHVGSLLVPTIHVGSPQSHYPRGFPTFHKPWLTPRWSTLSTLCLLQEP